MTSVSIIIPVYRVSPYIERCLLSVINQTYKGPVECIIVDDKSPDDSIQKATRMISNYSGHIKFTILTHDENLGLSEARNSALRVATGDYVFFLDSDDEMSIYALELLTNKADSHPGIDVVYGGYYHSQYFNVGATNLPDIILGHEACKKAILKPRLLPGFAHNKLIRKGLFRGVIISISKNRCYLKTTFGTGILLNMSHHLPLCHIALTFISITPSLYSPHQIQKKFQTE